MKTPNLDAAEAKRSADGKFLFNGQAFNTTLLALICVLCAACTFSDPPAPTSTPTSPPPTPTPTPEPKILTVCLPEEPESLYLYSDEIPSIAAQHIWQAIYDGPFDSRDYAYQAVILEERPTIEAGGAVIFTATVQAGDRVLSADGTVTELSPGVAVRDIAGRRVLFDGAPVDVPQMAATFTLRSNLYWSDGVPLTANDSVFSYVLAADSAAPANRRRATERTATYRAVNPRTVVWTGVPGYLDQAYVLNFWHPLPQHAWGALSASELISASVSSRKPLGWGPFVIQEWVTGSHLTVTRNPIYYRAPEGLPYVDQIVFRFIPEPSELAQALLDGRCHVVTHEKADAVRAALPREAAFETYATPAPRWELLAFGITPRRDYERVDFFEDERVRQAIATCIDRQALISQTVGPTNQALHSYLPPEHPLHAGDALRIWVYDPEAGQTLLESAGWHDEDGDAVREAHDIPGIPNGTPFQVDYHTSNDPLRVRVAQMIQSQLATCGIQVNVNPMAVRDLFAPGPDGPLFGRRFDLAQFSWRTNVDPLCDLFVSSQMPDPGRWQNPNVAGFLDDDYDTACQAALQAPPGSEIYIARHVESQVIFSRRLPVLPLFQRLKTTFAAPDVVGLSPNVSEPSELWSVEQFDISFSKE